MAEVIWSPSALQDVEDIAEFISRDSSEHAALFVERLIEKTDRLAEYPFSGRIIPEIGNRVLTKFRISRSLSRHREN